MVYESTDKQSETAPQVIVEERNTDNEALYDRGDLKKFADNHVSSTTKFQSAEALLNRKDPLVYIWLLVFIVCVIMMGPSAMAIMSELNIGLKLLVILLIGIFFGHTAEVIARGIIRLRCRRQTSGQY